MDGIRGWIEAEGTGHWFFVAFPVILLCLFIWFKGRRVCFLIPSLIISIVIINPVFYKYWDEFGLYAYWRILWVIPVIPVVAGLVPSLTERIHKGWLKCIVVAAGVGVVVLGGTFLYNGAGGSFVEAANVAKLPDYVVRIADRLLELEDRPRVIAQDPIGVYLRQYTGEIDQLFGRDLRGYIWSPSRNAAVINNMLGNGEMDAVAQYMLDDGFANLVYNTEGSEHFELVDNVADYGIFKAKGRPTVIKERNALGQVSTHTILDEQGSPVNGANGYSTVSRDYDCYGNITYEFHTDKDGKGVLDGNGRAGFKREYDSQGHILKEQNLGVSGELVVSKLEYAEAQRRYQDGNLIEELFYDSNGNPINCINGYAKKECEYDRAGNLIRERYLSASDQPAVAAAGYAEKACEYENGKLIKESYYGTNGLPLTQAAGYCAITQEWNGSNLIRRTYLDKDNREANRNDGYSRAEWRQDSNGTWNVSFYDVENCEVPIEGINLAGDLLTSSDGWSEWMIPAYDNENYCVYLGNVNLGKKEPGDIYTVQVNIEYKNVSACQGKQICYFTQGLVDNGWNVRNIWNGSLVWMDYAPIDGVYHYYVKQIMDDKAALASNFAIGFRCDNWESGIFRVNKVQIEKEK